MTKFIIKGRDAYGNPMVETIEATPITWRGRLRIALVCILGYRISYLLGLTKVKRYSGIRIK